MLSSPAYNAPPGRLSCDILVAGAGIVGLWTAYFAARRGLTVVIADRREVGAGASGGVLGALMPHMPDRWNAKKQFQLDALVSLEAIVERLEAETGLFTGYRRCGRLMPLKDPKARVQAEERRAGAAAHWADGTFDWQLIDRPPASGWPPPDAVPHGAVLETLSARIAPRRLIGALAAALRASPCVTIVERDGVLLDSAGKPTLMSGTPVAAGLAVVAAGHESFPLIMNHLGTDLPLGRPVKGQAALLEGPVGEDLPLIFEDGVYLVPHEDGRLAIGSTSEDRFDDPLATDDRLDTLIERAQRLAPVVGRCQVFERWAGLRPRAAGVDPMIGMLPGPGRVMVATGGYKITLGIAHRMAGVALAIGLDDDTAGLPASFSMEAHVAKAERLKESG